MFGEPLVALEDELELGIAHEKALRWADALAVYERLENRAATPAARVDVVLRKANALMELGRPVEARTAFDAAIERARSVGDSGVLSKALLGAGVFAANSGNTARAEPFLLKALELASSRGDTQDRLTAGWAMLTLGGLYGRTGRLDLAFVTLQDARDRLGAIGDWTGVAAAWESQAQLRRAIGDEERWREDLAEAVLMYRRGGHEAKAERLQRLLGRKLL